MPEGKGTVLVVDDDETLLELVADQLSMAGYRPIVAADGASGLQRVDDEQPDLVILDVMIPGMDGWEVCDRLRQGSQIPIIMLTAKEGEFDKLRAFQLGVDDYVTKPFSFAELVARVGAVLARTRGGRDPHRRVDSGDLAIDFELRRVTLEGREVSITPREYGLLEELTRHQGRPVPTEQLLLKAWGPEYAGETEQVKRYIWSLRQKLEQDPGDPKHILTERGFGYRFE
ncbi:MAG: response regulator transcription factor [Anaerolineales bacterium]